MPEFTGHTSIYMNRPKSDLRGLSLSREILNSWVLYYAYIESKDSKVFLTEDERKQSFMEMVWHGSFAPYAKFFPCLAKMALKVKQGLLAEPDSASQSRYDMPDRVKTLGSLCQDKVRHIFSKRKGLNADNLKALCVRLPKNCGFSASCFLWLALQREGGEYISEFLVTTHEGKTLQFEVSSDVNFTISSPHDDSKDLAAEVLAIVQVINGIQDDERFVSDVVLSKDVRKYNEALKKGDKKSAKKMVDKAHRNHNNGLEFGKHMSYSNDTPYTVDPFMAHRWKNIVDRNGDFVPDENGVNKKHLCLVPVKGWVFDPLKKLKEVPHGYSPLSEQLSGQ